MVQWLGISAFIAGGTGSIPDWGIKILQAVKHGQQINNKRDQKEREPENTHIPTALKYTYIYFAILISIP